MLTALETVHPDWQAIVQEALACMDQSYLKTLSQNNHWLPGLNKVFAAFSQPINKLRYVLLGESPYPRPQSANGFAFWDARVHKIFSATGFSKEVNRATSLRNFIKMLLLANGDLQHDFSQEAIAKLDKSAYCQTIEELFHAMIEQGFLLLNVSLVYSPNEVPFHARHWEPFMQRLLLALKATDRPLQLLLFGRIAQNILKLTMPEFHYLSAPHPYNLSFITHPEVLAFFKPLQLLRPNEHKH